MARDNYLEEQNEAYFQNSLIEQEVLELLFDSIQALPEKYRRLFDLSFEQGLKNAEIAKMLDISESAVKKQKSNMIRQMREEMARRTDKDYMAVVMFLMMLRQ